MQGNLMKSSTLLRNTINVSSTKNTSSKQQKGGWIIIMNFYLRVLHETSIKNTLFTVVQNRKFKTVKYTEDCLKQYITDRCWLLESRLGSTASISFPPPLPSLFLKHRMAHNGPWLLFIPGVCRDTVTLTPYPSAIPYSPFIFLWNIISFQFSTIHHIHIHISSLSFLLRYWAQKTHICFTDGKTTS